MERTAPWVGRFRQPGGRADQQQLILRGGNAADSTVLTVGRLRAGVGGVLLNRDISRIASMTTSGRSS
jgi:hypothetical protein